VIGSGGVKSNGAVVAFLCAVSLGACGGAPGEPDMFKYTLLAASSPAADDGSSIVADCLGSGVPPALPEPLSGTFVLSPATEQSANASRFALADIAFRSGSYAVVGESGLLTLFMGHQPDPLSMTLSVAINGQPVELSGSGSVQTFSGSPPALRNVHLTGQAGPCGAAGVLEYRLTIFAMPEV
jgi:hypothetical protein